MKSDASWADKANDRYRQDVATRRQNFEARQRWLFEHRDREVIHCGRRYVIRLRRRHRSFRESGAVWMQWVLHGLRNLVGDVIRLLLGRRHQWSVGIFDMGHALGALRAVEVRHCSNEQQAIAEADRLVEELAKSGLPGRHRGAVWAGRSSR